MTDLFRKIGNIFVAGELREMFNIARWLLCLIGIVVPAVQSLGAQSPQLLTNAATRMVTQPAEFGEIPPGGTDFGLDRGVGLFVGINEFADPGLAALKYAVNDAISLAHHFVSSGQIDPKDCHLLLSGKPVGPEVIRKLEELGNKGIVPQPAIYTTILAKARLLITPQPGNFVFISFGTHGFFNKETKDTYLMPADGTQTDMKDIAVSVAKISDRLSESGAKKAILFIDACRSKTFVGTRGPELNSMTDAFRTAFDAAHARATFQACVPGQVSYESETFQQGVFTHYFLEGVQGKAGVNNKGFITLGTLIDFVSIQVRGWVEKERPGAPKELQQQPALDAAEVNRQAPIARSKIYDEEIKKIAQTRAFAMKVLLEAYGESTLQPKFGNASLTEISMTLAKLPIDPQGFVTSPLGQMIQMIENQLRKPTPASVEALVAWWTTRKAELSEGTLKVTTEPTGATLVVDGITTTLVTPINAKLPGGQHRIIFSLSGYEPFEQVIELEPGRTVELGKISLRESVRPRLRNLEAVKLKVGEKFRRTLEVENGPATLTVTALPKGLSFDAGTRTIQGAPIEAGAFLAKISAVGAGKIEINDTLAFEIEEVSVLKIPRVSDGKANVTKGGKFEYKIDADGSPTNFSATGLPIGLTVDRSTGMISGKPRKAGSFSVMLFASNSAGRGSGELDLEVEEPDPGPIPGPKPVPPPTSAYSYTFFIGNITYKCTADGRILDPNGRYTGQLGPGVMANSVGQLNFGTAGFFHAYPDGNLVAHYPNGTWVIRGRWQPGG